MSPRSSPAAAPPAPSSSTRLVDSAASTAAVDRAADYVPIEEAAARLTLTPLALRARCRRAARRVGREIVAHLGAGVVAYKFGRSWRVHFPLTAA
jgi:hypothetical protein